MVAIPSPFRVAVEQLGLKPTPEFMAILEDDPKEMIVTGGVRSGKSTLSAAKIWTDERFLLGHDDQGKRALFWIIGPTYQGANKEMEYLYSWASRYGHGLIKRAFLAKDEAQSLELINGTLIETRTSQHPERIASDAPHRILVVEAGQQPVDVVRAARARALENRAHIMYSGTLEEHMRFAWYEEMAEDWLKDPTPEHRAYSLPSWTNLSVFPLGYNDPDIQYRLQNDDEYSFARTYAGIPGGAQTSVYRRVAQGDSLLLPLSPTTRWIDAVGGIDYGSIHPSAAVVVTLSDEALSGTSDLNLKQRHVAWVRECWWDGGLKSGDFAGDTAQLTAAKRRLTSKYHCYAWAIDPNQRGMGGMIGATAVNLGAGSRERRIGMVRARLNAGTLKFDLHGPGVYELYQEMKRVKYTKMASGELQLLRVNDDRTAALEDAIEILDNMKRMEVTPSVANAPRYAATRPRPRIGGA